MKNYIELSGIKLILLIILFFVAILLIGSVFVSVSVHSIIIGLILFTSLFLTIQGAFTLFWMLYAWNNDTDEKSSKKLAEPRFSFTALLPARHEEKVIKDTVRAINRIDYPENLKEILILVREDDTETLQKAREVMKEIGTNNIRLITFNSYPINKPHSLNHGLKNAKNELITIFDAEDEPHPDIYNIVNTIMVRERVDVVQSGVQLMNYRSHWFSALNVLEYYFWFKSGLHFFSKIGKVTPLGGNTVFFKKNFLKYIDGWDEKCLTEDADVGIRLALAGARTRVVYDERYATREETPCDTASFIKQRTRWNQGFIQIFLKGDWLKLPSISQKTIVSYVLLSPLIQALFLLYAPVSLWLTVTNKIPIVVSLLTFIPFFIFIIQMLDQVVGLYEFTKAYKLKFPFWMPFKLLLTFYPYQFVLMYSSFRAFYRIAFSDNGWEKTLHMNDHRLAANRSLFSGVSVN